MIRKIKQKQGKRLPLEETPIARFVALPNFFIKNQNLTRSLPIQLQIRQQVVR